MSWTTIKDKLTKATGYDLSISGPMGKSKTITLTMHPGSPFPLTFKTLGSGSMKRVVQVEGEAWVLAMAGDSSSAKLDMKGEVVTLLSLRDHVRVPEPFASSDLGNILFDLEKVYNDDGDEKTYPAFLQQFLPFQEMDKLAKREDFAKDFILKGGVPITIATTVDDLKKVHSRLAAGPEWGDFQVMYDKLTGFVYVFDPLPVNNSGVNAAPIVKKWLDDIEAARNP